MVMPSTTVTPRNGIDTVEQAVACVVARCRPDFVSAYETAPDALSSAIQASANGSRAYLASTGWDLLDRVHGLFIASRRGLPIVMTVTKSASGAPDDCWNDDSEVMAIRDCGWIQLFAANEQEAVDLHVQAFRIAEQLSLPVMVCLDASAGPFKPPAIPAQADVDAFLTASQTHPSVDLRRPMTPGPESGYLLHLEQRRALEVVERVAGDFRQRFGRGSGGSIDLYYSRRAKTVVLALGLVIGQLDPTIVDMRKHGVSIAAIGLKSFRPFPATEIRASVRQAERVIVFERGIAPGVGGIVSADVRAALAGRPVKLHTVIAWLGGQAITRRALAPLLYRATRGGLAELEFLGLRTDVVQRELTRDVVERELARGGTLATSHATNLNGDRDV
jgi:pyruvate ferredoxin oxidoreductase alpha subunit